MIPRALSRHHHRASTILQLVSRAKLDLRRNSESIGKISKRNVESDILGIINPAVLQISQRDKLGRDGVGERLIQRRQLRWG